MRVVQTAKREAVRLDRRVYVEVRPVSRVRDGYTVTDVEPASWIYAVDPDGTVTRPGS